MMKSSTKSLKKMKQKSNRTSRWTKRTLPTSETLKIWKQNTNTHKLQILVVRSRKKKKTLIITQMLESNNLLLQSETCGQRSSFSSFQNKFNLMSSSDSPKTGSSTQKYRDNTKFFRAFWNKDGEKCPFLKYKPTFLSISKKTTLFTPTGQTNSSWKMWWTTTSFATKTGNKR